MSRPLAWRPILLTGLALTAVLVALAALLPGRRAGFDQRLDARTEVRDSQIPGAGLGLYARVPLKAGEVVGELGGRYHAHGEPLEDHSYLAAIPDCGLQRARPWVSIDARVGGGHVARINFAPRRLQGQDTLFQNTQMVGHCEPPYVVFEATRDIAAGEELWVSYGKDYDYGFMALSPVRDFFCQRAKVVCGEGYRWEP